MNRQQIEELAAQIVDSLIEVHREKGPGLLESAYEMCLCREFSLRGIPFEPQKPMPVFYKGASMDCGYRLDLLVADTIVLELKAVADLLPIHEAQLLTYLRLADKPLGFLINFNVRRMKDGLHRFAHTLPPHQRRP